MRYGKLSAWYCLPIFILIFGLFGCENTPVDSLTGAGGANGYDALDGVASKASAPTVGYALALDGIGDYALVPDAPSLDMTGGFTIVAWVNINQYTEWASIVTKGGVPGTGDAITPNNYTIHQSGPAGGSASGHLRFTGSSPALPTSPYLESNTQIPLNEWHFVAVTYDGSMLQFYYDGNPDGGGSLEGPLTPNEDPLHIGADFPGADEFWNGMIDELKIWNVALSPAHIRASMHGSATPRRSNLAGFWGFNEGFGTVAADRSGNGNDAALVDDAMFFPTR